VIPFVINMMNSVDSLPMIFLTELPTVKMARYHFFCFVLIIFFRL